MQYRVNNTQGCGCLPVLILLVLAVSMFPGLIKVLASVPLIMIGLFFAFTWYIQRRVSEYEASQTETHRHFVVLLINILVKIAQSDGHFTKAELRTILNFFQYNLHYNQDQMYWVKQLVKEARHSTTSLDELLAEFRSSFNYESRLILLELIFQIVYVKEPPLEAELRMARNIAQVLEINAYDQRTIEAKFRYGWRSDSEQGSGYQSGGRQGGSYQRGGYQGSGYGSYQGGGRSAQPDPEEHYYAVLGLEKGAGFDEIKKSYRKLCLQYHPDKVAHLGDEFKLVAEEKMKEINVAYGYFEKRFK